MSGLKALRGDQVDRSAGFEVAYADVVEGEVRHPPADVAMVVLKQVSPVRTFPGRASFSGLTTAISCAGSTSAPRPLESSSSLRCLRQRPRRPRPRVVSRRRRTSAPGRSGPRRRARRPQPPQVTPGKVLTVRDNFSDVWEVTEWRGSSI
jgi:hypothetical protein